MSYPLYCALFAVAFASAVAAQPARGWKAGFLLLLSIACTVAIGVLLALGGGPPI